MSSNRSSGVDRPGGCHRKRGCPSGQADGVEATSTKRNPVESEELWMGLHVLHQHRWTVSALAPLLQDQPAHGASAARGRTPAGGTGPRAVAPAHRGAAGPDMRSRGVAVTDAVTALRISREPRRVQRRWPFIFHKEKRADTSASWRPRPPRRVRVPEGVVVG